MSRAKIIAPSEILPAPFPKAKNFENLSGRFFGSAAIICYAGSSNQRTMWYCRCSCGNYFMAQAANLKKGQTSSCGCFHSLRGSQVHKTHGFSNRQRESGYTCWMSMKARCKDPKNNSYKSHGARGIKICERWMKFENFIADMGERPSLKHSIDRIDNNGNYEPGNCRWATSSQQNTNKRNTIHLVYEGEAVALVDACRITGKKYGTITSRIWKEGMTPEEAFNMPLSRKPPREKNV